MAKSNGSCRSKRRGSGKSFSSASSGSTGVVSYSAHARSFKRRPFCRTPISVVCEAFDQARTGAASSVSAKRGAARRWSNSGIKRNGNASFVLDAKNEFGMERGEGISSRRASKEEDELHEASQHDIHPATPPPPPSNGRIRKGIPRRAPFWHLGNT